MKTEILHVEQPNAYEHALDILTHGGLVAFPTDTVYGLATLAFEAQYVNQLYAAKGRNHTKAIAILLSDASQLSQVSLDPGEMATILAEKFWPGPLTLVVPRHPDVPEEVSRLPTLGVRIPDHPVALRLFQLAGPLAVTSANLSGEPSVNTAQQVLKQMDGRIHLILDGGRTPGGVPSTVVECTTSKPVILRKGPISMKKIKESLHILGI